MATPSPSRHCGTLGCVTCDCPTFHPGVCSGCAPAARARLEAEADNLGGYGRENIGQFLRGDFSCASPEDVEYLRAALRGESDQERQG